MRMQVLMFTTWYEEVLSLQLHQQAALCIGGDCIGVLSAGPDGAVHLPPTPDPGTPPATAT